MVEECGFDPVSMEIVDVRETAGTKYNASFEYVPKICNLHSSSKLFFDLKYHSF